MGLDWDLVESILQKQIKQKPQLTAGVTEINELLSAQGIMNIFDNIDTNRMQEEFDQWLNEVINHRRIPKHIKAIYFGIFSMVDPEDEDRAITTIYFSGSPESPFEDEDWACWVDSSYLPENRYFMLTDFTILDENIKSLELSSEAEVVVFNSLFNLLILNSLEKFQDSFLLNHKSLFIGAGFDEGDKYVLGKLTKNGWE